MLIVSWFLAGCTLAVPLSPAPTAMFSPTDSRPTQTFTPLPSATWTSTLPSPTFSPVPTLIYPTSRGKPSLDFPTPTPTPLMYFPPKESGFFSVVVSRDVVFWGGCEPAEVEIAARVLKPQDVAYVTLFLRYANQVTGVHSDWLPYIMMQNAGFGLYRVTVNANDLERKFYSPSWLELQLVATNARLKTIGRTETIREAVAFFPCP
ncbi:MAG: hypothetical protein ACP5QU_08195 [Anaerolineae bacterium]